VSVRAGNLTGDDPFPLRRGAPDPRDQHIADLRRRLADAERERREGERDLRLLAARLRREARTDPLTELENRRSYELELEAEWRLAQRGAIQSHLVLADIDSFKSVNDRRGHAVGDAVLQLVARAMRPARGTDLVARIGGDEFAAILVGCPDRAGAEAYVNRVRERVRAESTYHAPAVDLSFGFCDLAVAASPRAATIAADMDLYRAKREAAALRG
jgi:diguanylate cyclase (GGDEF)-like protein